MKKYQMWLERKTYSQHLDNLTRIKLSSKERLLPTKLSLDHHRAKNSSPNQSIIKSQPSLTSNEIQYIITSRQLQNHKLRLVRSNEIVRENQEMAKRIDRTRPFVCTTRPVDHTNYKLKRRMRRLNQEQSSQLKLKHYDSYMKICKQDADPTRRFELTLKVKSLQLRIPHKDQAEVAIEILAPKPIAKSQCIQATKLEGHIFFFLLSEPLPQQITLRIHTYRGLNHQVLASFCVDRPEEGSCLERAWPAQGQQGDLQAKLAYRHKTPKLWPIRPFKV